MANWKGLLNNDEPLNEQELMKYLHGSPSDEERFAIENQMAGSDFVNDAVEGLQQIKDPATLAAIKEQLNQQLKKTTLKKVSRKKHRKLQDQQWLILAVLVILALSVAGYLLIHFYSK